MLMMNMLACRTSNVYEVDDEYEGFWALIWRAVDTYVRLMYNDITVITCVLKSFFYDISKPLLS